MVQLKTTGFDILTEKDKSNFNKILSEHSRRIKNKLKNIEEIKIHLKEYNYEGNIKDKNKKYSINLTVSYAGKFLKANSVDWDLSKVFHKVFKKIESEVEKKFKQSNQHKPWNKK